MPQLFERRDVFGNSPAVWILAALLFAAPLGWQSLSQLERRDDVGMVLPPSDPVRQTFEWAAESFPLQHDLLVTWTGSSINDPRVAAFRHRLEPTRDSQGVLRGGVPQIATVSHPRSLLQQMLDHQVAPDEAVRRLTGSGLGRGPLCLRLTEEGRNKQRRFQVDLPIAAEKKWGIELTAVAPGAVMPFTPRALEETAGEQQEPLEIEPVEIETDGTLRANVEPAHDLEITWSGVTDAEFIAWLQEFKPDGTAAETPMIADLFYLPGSPLALDVTFSEAGRADRSATLKQVRDAAVAVGVPLTDLKIAGPAVVEEDLQTATRRAVWNPAFPWQQLQRRSALLTSLIAAVLMTILVLRDLRLILITLGTSAASVFVTLALMPVTGVHLTVFLFAVPVLVGAVALTGTLHIARQWQSCHSTEDDHAVRHASSQTIMAGLTVTGLAAVAALVWSVSPLLPIRDWSEATCVAFIASFVLVQFGVPALLLLWRGRPAPLSHDPALWQALGTVWLRRPWAQAAGVLIVIVAATYGLRYAQPQIDLAHGLPLTYPSHQAVAVIEGQVVGTIPAETLIRFDARSQDERDVLDRMELVRAVTAELRNHAAVSGCLSWADFFPVTPDVDDEASRLETTRRTRLAQSMMDDWRDGDARPSAAAFYTVAKQDRDADLDGDRGYSHRGDEFWRISTRVRWTNSAELARTQRELDALVQGVLKAAPGTRHRITGPLAIQVRTEQLAFRSFLIAAGIAAGLMVVALIFSLQHLGAALLALLPCVAPSTVVLGVWSVLGGRLDLAAMLSAGLSAGLAAGQVLPLIWSFRKALVKGRSREEAVPIMLGDAGPHAWRSAWILGLTILPLSTSEAAVVSHFGMLLPAMVGTAVLLQLMWLPQLLAGPLGLCFSTTPGTAAETKTETTKPPATTTQRAA